MYSSVQIICTLWFLAFCSTLGETERIAYCTIAGSCEKCPEQETLQKYCSESGYRQLLNCSWDDPGNSTSHERLTTRRKGGPPRARSCEISGADMEERLGNRRMSLLSFEMLVVTVLFAAFIIMLWRKRQIPFP